LASIEKSLKKLAEKGTLSAGQAAEALGRLKPTLKLDDLADCDLVIEAIIENLEPKRELFRTIDAIVKPEAVFASNTSSLCITEILFNEYRERRFAPPPLMKRMVLAGMYGRKSGKGFYDYTDPKNPKPNNLLLG